MRDTETPKSLADADLDAATGGSGRHGELDHMGAYNFMVEISGVNAGYFKGVDGLQAEIEVIELKANSPSR